ncbi:hypothetical protein B296_00013889 [Ensete ventricosum]|uniref:POX domain-containing protein n=1 Tax=Ensete ventricosum TaxID=4639 RepID=A0A427AXJ8_ENSVE|nr:hypothetical protein B296_00013889 [Ensete ventricosum]
MEALMVEKRRVEKSLDDEQRFVFDSSVDHEGRVPRRASTGCWKASLERLCYFGLATNLIIYLTTVLHQELKTAAKNVNYWSGVTTVMPLIGGFIADAYLGRFSTVLVSTLIYIGGLLLLTMSQIVPRLKPCDPVTCGRSLRLHEIIFFLAMYLISLGTGGHKPSLESFGADQFDDNHDEERRKKMSFFNWWNFALCSGLILGVTVFVYVQDRVGWWQADFTLTATMALSLVIFLAGRPFYRYRKPEGSPFRPMLQVVAAAVAKRHLPLPSDARELCEVPRTQTTSKRLLCHTNKLRFLDKAAIIEHKDDEAATAAAGIQNPWRLATVTQVEELKLVLSMVPIWVTVLPFGICVAQTNTFFVKQGSVMDRQIGNGFIIPAASLFSLAALGMVTSVTFYDRMLVPFLRRVTGDERGVSILRRIGIGMAITTAGMISAALVERKRLKVAEKEGTVAVSMSVFWLAPQFMIVGVGDGFALVGLQEYFYDQVPDSMRSLGIAFYLSVLGVSNFISSFLIIVVDRVTSRGGRGSWFAKELNKSRLDLFYWLLAIIGTLNLCCYVLLARRYSYKKVQQSTVGVIDSSEDDSFPRAQFKFLSPTWDRLAVGAIYREEGGDNARIDLTSRLGREKSGSRNSRRKKRWNGVQREREMGSSAADRFVGGGEEQLLQQQQPQMYYHVPQHSRREKLRFAQEVSPTHTSLLVLHDHNAAPPLYPAGSLTAFLPSFCTSSSSSDYSHNPAISYGVAQFDGHGALPIPSQHQRQIHSQGFSLSLSSSSSRPTASRHQVITRTTPLGPFTGYAAVLNRSRFLDPARNLLEEVCHVGQQAAGDGGSREVLLDVDPSRESLDHGGDGRPDHGTNADHQISGMYQQQWKKTSLISMLDEVYRRYKQYYQQVQTVITSFESVAGLSTTAPYASMALKAMSKHFRCLKNIISDQIHQANKGIRNEGNSREEISSFGLLNNADYLQRTANSTGTFAQPHVWRPQRGLPERAVSVLRSWLFEHFLHPYPTDVDKQNLAKQTGLTRNQVIQYMFDDTRWMIDLEQVV